MTRGHIEQEKCPLGGFYSGGRTSQKQNMEDALLILSACFCGSRWIQGASFTGHNPRYETATIMLHRDRVHGHHKCKASEAERSFIFLHVAADICPESMVRLIVSELHQQQISCVRITECWPNRPLIGQELDPATITVVLQTDQARQAAVHFRQNNEYLAYSHGWKGLVAQEYRSIKVGEAPVSWNMDSVWQQNEQRERNSRSRLKEQHGMGAHDEWGNLGDCPQDCTFHDIDPQ